jgi:hypothetical protein
MITNNRTSLKSMILEELKTSYLEYHISSVKNKQLKSILEGMNVSEISVTYNSTSTVPRFSLPYLGNNLDSTITFSWITQNKSKVKYLNIYVFFGAVIPKHQVIIARTHEDIKINDSIWMQKAIYQKVISH